MSVVGLVESIADREAWVKNALCAEVGPVDAFWYPEKGGSTKEAKRICAACPVAVECLRYAIQRDERFGVWGGLSERERRRLKATGMAYKVICNAGHNMDDTGRTAQGTCRECHNKWNRMYQARTRTA